jgi:2-polyprenyl-3-methyl-5-hydroxy-6-metoxy-1,4-benzoquinol methylase
MTNQANEGLLSPFLRRQRIGIVKNFLKGKVLDIGAGGGYLAQYVAPNLYVGIEPDDVAIDEAKNSFTSHNFYTQLNNELEKFDTVVALAVIEHVPSPADFLKELKCYLSTNPHSKIVITTPHPAVDWVHYCGAQIGLFSRHANEEHNDLLNKKKLFDIGTSCGLTLIHYKRFLFGANQLAIYKATV